MTGPKIDLFDYIEKQTETSLELLDELRDSLQTYRQKNCNSPAERDAVRTLMIMDLAGRDHSETIH